MRRSLSVAAVAVFALHAGSSPTPAGPGDFSRSSSVDITTTPAAANTVATTSTSPVTSWNIFWALLALSLAVITHPLGTTGSLNPKHRLSIRTNPLIALLDAVYLLYEILRHYRTYVSPTGKKPSLQGSTASVVANRLSQTIEPTSTASTAFRDLRVRSILSICCILQYAKLCGSTGIPIPLTIATVLFASWAILEITFFAAATMKPQRTPHPERLENTPQLPQYIYLWTVLLQAVATLLLILHPRSGQPDHLGAIWRFYVWVALTGPMGWVVQVSERWSGAIAGLILGDSPGFLRTAFGFPLFLILVLPVLLIATPVFTYIAIVTLGPVLLGGVVLCFSVIRGWAVVKAGYRQPLYTGRMLWAVVVGVDVVGVARVTAVWWVLGVGVYCAVGYDPVGTAKAGWTEALP